jgi:hypothetical protein
MASSLPHPNSVTLSLVLPQTTIISNSLPSDMLSFNVPTWQISLLSAAQQRSGRRGQSSPFGRGHTTSEVLPRLYLTDLFTARDEAQLTTLGITHVVSVIEHAPALPQVQSLRTLHIPLSGSSAHRHPDPSTSYHLVHPRCTGREPRLPCLCQCQMISHTSVILNLSISSRYTA